ncbi:MAG: hypothetical protein M5U19_00660 [Microthrixaceae bacterium]|nr:hypothetical protein [Microthrixaceae bacterium]
MKTKLVLGSVIAAISLTFLLPGGFAAAQDGTDPYISPSPTVAEATTVPPAPDAVASTSEESGAPTGVASNELTTNEVASSNLAFTGGDVAALAGVGLLAIALGFAMVILRNRNRGADTVA